MNIFHNNKSSKKKDSDKKLFGIIAVVFLFVAVYGVIQQINPSQDEVAAIVNGEVITMAELNKAYDVVPAQFKDSVDKETLLDQIIEIKLLLQEAEKQGIEVDPAEVINYIQLLKLSSGLDDEQFAARLKDQQTTEQDLIDQYEKQIIINSLINQTILNKIDVTEKEIEDYYNDNLDNFKVDEEVTVRHILIGSEEITAEEQDAQAKSLLSELTQENFCDYVTEYSTDTVSVATCGEYKFTKEGSFVEEFKDLSFEQKVGKMGIVQTQFGTHIIWTVKKTKPGTLSLDESNDKIIEFIKSQRGRENYKIFYDELKNNSQIEIKFSGS